jgi:hypothetical protein
MRPPKYIALTGWLLCLLVMTGCKSTPVALPDMKSVREGDMIVTNQAMMDMIKVGSSNHPTNPIC